MKAEVLDSINTNSDIKITVICITYNHKPYIRNTLDQLVNQKTNFTYEIIVHDDNSSDGTKEIIKEYYNKYPLKIRAILESENQYSKGIDFEVNKINPMINGHYICYCEGDDYWPDLNKLQLQYNFLEKNNEYVAVGGITDYITDNGDACQKSKPYKKYLEKEYKVNDYLGKHGANVGTNTVMFRKQIVISENYLNAKKERTKIGDLLLMISIFDNGKFYVIDKVFQKHIIQTRSNSSNFNSIYTYKQKFIYTIQAANSIKNFKKEYNMKLFLREHTTLYFCYCLLNLKLKDFFECRKMIYHKYKENLFICLLKSIPSVISYMFKL